MNISREANTALEAVTDAAALLESRRTFAGVVEVSSALERVQEKLNAARATLAAELEAALEVGR
jgi:hypothetical protein